MRACSSHALWVRPEGAQGIGDALAGPEVHVAVQEVRRLKAPQGDELPSVLAVSARDAVRRQARPSIPAQPGAPITPRMSRPGVHRRLGLESGSVAGTLLGW